MSLIATLEQNGFTAKEANIYLASLELGNAPASSIARKAWENRVTTYTVLKALCKKWYATEVVKNKTKYYHSLDPKYLIEKIQTNTKKLSDIFPQLEAMMNNWNKPKIYFYDGLEWIKLAYENAIKSIKPDEIMKSFTGDGEIDKEFFKYIEDDYVKLRKKYPFMNKMLLAGDVPKITEYNSEYKQIKNIKKGIFADRNQVLLYGGDKVGIFMYSPNELYALIIESKVFFNWLDKIFDFFWENDKLIK